MHLCSKTFGLFYFLLSKKSNHLQRLIVDICFSLPFELFFIRHFVIYYVRVVEFRDSKYFLHSFTRFILFILLFKILQFLIQIKIIPCHIKNLSISNTFCYLVFEFFKFLNSLVGTRGTFE